MRAIPIEIHTSYLTDQSTFPFYDCYRVVYHCKCLDDLHHIKKTGNEIVRVVFVVTNELTLANIMDIAGFVKLSNEIDELSFRQCVDGNYQIVQTEIDEYLKTWHKELWYYIKQNDYNLYYAENQTFHKYEDLKNGLKKLF